MTDHKIHAKTQIDDNLERGLQIINAAFRDVYAEAKQTGVAVQLAGREAETSAKRVGAAAQQWEVYNHKMRAAAAEMKGALLPGVGGVALGIVGLTAALGESIKAAAAEEAGTQRLAIALKDNVASWDGNLEAIERVVEARKKLSFDDEEQRDSLAQLVRHTHDVSTALQVEGVAMDFARGRQISLEQASNLLGKALDGNVGVLRRYGVQIRDGATASQAMAAVHAQFAGQAEAYSHTAAGSLDRLKISIDDAFKKAGTALLPVVADLATKFADALPKVLNVAKGLSDFLAPAFEIVGMVAAPIVGIIGGVIEILDALLGKSEEAGKGVGEAFPNALQEAIASGAVTVENAASDTVSKLDKSDEAGGLGQAVGEHYAVGTPGGITGGMSAHGPDVKSGAAHLVLLMDVRAKAADMGTSVGDAFAIAAAKAASANTLGIPIGGGPASSQRPSGGMITLPWEPKPPAPQIGQTHSTVSETSPEQGVDVERKRHIEQAQAATIALGNAQIAEAEAAAKAAAAQQKHGDALARKAQQEAEALRNAQEQAREAQHSIDTMTDQARAADLVAQAEAHLTEVQNQNKASLEALRNERDTYNATLQEGEDRALAQANASAVALAQYQKEAEARTRELNAELRKEQQELKEVEAAAKTALQPLIDKANEAAEAVRKIQEATAAQNNEFDKQARELTQRLQPLQDTLDKQNEALQAARDHVQAVSEEWDRTMAPAIERVKAATDELTAAQRALNDVQNEERLADRAERIRGEQLALDNLTVRIAQATGAQREQLELEKRALQEKMKREGKRDQAEDRVTDLTKRRQEQQDEVTKLQERRDAAISEAQALVKTAEETVKATQAKVKAIQDEQAALERLRAEYNYQQKQAEIIAQQKADQAAADLAREQKVQQAVIDAAKAEIDAVQAKIDKHQFEANEHERILAQKAKADKDAYDAWVGYHNSEMQFYDDKIAKAEARAKADEDSATRVVTAAKDVAREIGEAHRVLDTLNSAMERGATLTPQMATAYSNAETTLKGFHRDALSLIKKELDPADAGSLAAFWAVAWSLDNAKGFKKQHNTAVSEMGSALTIFHDSAVRQWNEIADAAQKYIDTVKTASGAPDTVEIPVTGKRAAGGPVEAGLPYLVGERGPEYFMPAQSGYIYPTGSVPYRSQGGREYSGGATTINLTVPISFGGQPMISKEQISYTARRAILEAIRETGKQVGNL